jgi:hypothetical protein
MKMSFVRGFALLAVSVAAVVLPHSVRADDDHDDDHHSDIIVGYNSGADRIEFESPSPGLLKPRLFEAAFQRLELLGDVSWTTDDPGFSGETGHYEFTAGDNLFLRVINANTYFQNGSNLGYVSFFDGTVFSAAGQIDIFGNDGDSLSLNGSMLSSSPATGVDFVFLQTTTDADNTVDRPYGGLHDHVSFDMVDGENQEVGAYGILFQLFNQNGAESDAFWIVFNRGVENEATFDGYVAAFGNFSAVPEPSSGLLLCGVALAAFAGRRRRG